MSSRHGGFAPGIRPDGSVAQANGGGSSNPIRQVIERRRLDGDQAGEIHLALCDHTPIDRRPVIYLHLHTNNTRRQGRDKPVAFNAYQLRQLIDELTRIEAMMLALRLP